MVQGHMIMCWMFTDKRWLNQPLLSICLPRILLVLLSTPSSLQSCKIWDHESCIHSGVGFRFFQTNLKSQRRFPFCSCLGLFSWDIEDSKDTSYGSTNLGWARELQRWKSSLCSYQDPADHSSPPVSEQLIRTSGQTHPKYWFGLHVSITFLDHRC